VGRVLKGRVTLALELPYQEGQRFYKQNVSGRVTLLPGSELWPISFTKTSTKRGSIFPETFIVFIEHACFPNVSQFCHTGTIVSSISFCFQGANYASVIQQRILTIIRACEQLQKFCEHEQASTHLIIASNSSGGQVLRALSNLMGPFDIPT